MFVRLEELIPRDAPNRFIILNLINNVYSLELKYLKNKEILFKERLYTPFNLNLKIVKNLFFFYSDQINII